ncbi:MAG TPA: type II secretion system protein [Polyangiaceae bacterium]|jgi:type IV pilus assembly protein PilA
MQPAPPYQAPRKGGFPTWAIVLLVVGGLVVVFGGIFAMLAVFGVRKYIANAKTAEARNSVAQIAKDAASEYEEEQLDPRGKPTHRVCPSATRSVPTSIASVSGKKYQSAPGDWTVDAPTHAGFACLKYSMEAPQYYMYSYAATPTSFTATAQGDLNADGVTSSFVLRGEVQPNGALQVEPNIQETNPAE